MKDLMLVLVGLLALGGCQSHVVYVQEINAGLNVAVSADGNNRLSIGYDRDVYAIVPMRDDGSDAMALFSLNRADLTDLDDFSVDEFVATGQPAEDLAQQPSAVQRLRDKIYAERDQ